MISPMKYERGVLRLLDQRTLPHEISWITCQDLEDVAVAIENMTVRGAPAIGCAAAYGLAIDAFRFNSKKIWIEYKNVFFDSCKRLSNTRPTAVNLFFTIEAVKKLTSKFCDNTSMEIVKRDIERVAQDIFESDLNTCKTIGQNGLKTIGHLPIERLSVLTHCNAGSLATAGYGTALGVIRSLHSAHRLRMVFADETRPFLQGSRLTAFELSEEKIPFTLIVDSAAAHFMKNKMIDVVVVGADRIACNGDAANKIGTYSVAVNAKHHQIPFYIAAPLSTFDPSIETGAQIKIEDRSPSEITHFNGIKLAPLGVIAQNPSFDVTPNELISGIITEKGVLTKPFSREIKRLFNQ